MEQINLSSITNSGQAISQQGVTKVKIDLIAQKDGQPFLQAVNEAKNIQVFHTGDATIISFKEGGNLIDSYTVEELFDLIKTNII